MRYPRDPARRAAAILPWTYDLPPEGDGSEGLEGYGVESSSGERLGSVFLVLRRGSNEYLVIRRQGWRRDLRVVPWADVGAIDHAAGAVLLRLSAGDLAGAPALSPARGIHGDGADAVRVPGPKTFESTGTAAHGGEPAGRYLLACGLGALGFLTLLAAFLLVSTPRYPDAELAAFALPAVLLLGALASAAGLVERARPLAKVVGHAREDDPRLEEQ